MHSALTLFFSHPTSNLPGGPWSSWATPIVPLAGHCNHLPFLSLHCPVPYMVFFLNMPARVTLLKHLSCHVTFQPIALQQVAMLLGIKAQGPCSILQSSCDPVVSGTVTPPLFLQTTPSPAASWVLPPASMLLLQSRGPGCFLPPRMLLAQVCIMEIAPACPQIAAQTSPR